MKRIASEVVEVFYLMKKGQGERQSYSNGVEVVLGKWQLCSI